MVSGVEGMEKVIGGEIGGEYRVREGEWVGECGGRSG